MAVDLPPGKWTAALIGPWWPAPSTALRAGAQHWSQVCAEQQLFSQDLRSQWTMIAAHNQGRTADDLISRYQQGEKFHLDLAEKYQSKAGAFNAGADAIDYLRSRLADIANSGNREIDEILASKKSLPEQVAEVQAVQLRCNGDAANASMNAVDKLMTATQKIFDAEGVGSDARMWAREQGFNVENPSSPRPITQEDLGSSTPLSVGGGSVTNALSPHGHLPRVSPTGFGGGSAPNAPAPGSGNFGSGFGGGSVPAGPAVAPSPGVQVPGSGGTVSPGMPGVSGSPMTMSPAGLGQGTPNLAQSFASGMATGQPAGAAAQGLSSGAINAMESGAGTPPQPGAPVEAPPVAPTAPSAGVVIPASAPVDTPPPAASAPPAAGGTAPVTPVVTGGAWSGSAAPVAGSTSVPAGSLPAYGSDLRPPVTAPPAMPTVPTGPVSGAPVAPSASSSTSAGGPLVSPVERGAAAGQAGANSSSMVGASAMSAATGATAGVVSSRAAEQQRLQRLVDAVARQEPRVWWAAGLRDDGTTTLLVTDLASGWIPPHVKLPAHVTLLEPTARRRDASVVDLLGAVVVAAAHEHNTYVAESDPEAPTLSGDRPARSAAPHVDELGPALVQAVRRRDGLPRIAQAIAAPAVRNTGVLENETELLRSCIAEVRDSVLTAYPDHDAAAVGDWMLLAAIEALIDGHEYLANYHMAWFDVISHQGGG
ncbi:DUF5631 domain-containing protein [Mycobacterium sp. SMC-2]|uniref:DUF5631 domain-containing protein n=1 Tax=Mycobacterium sp. SMC-2 TaxID=2857058 RepID=UPI0021B336A2|nr:DUF5631 domain-containing protein [Mycobacterium sp. SMC-2]